MKNLYVLLFFIATLQFAQAQQRGTQNIGLGDITVIEIAPNGDLWAGSTADGLAFFNNAQQTWSYFDSLNTPQLTSNRIYDIDLAVINGIEHSFVGTRSGMVFSMNQLGWTAESQSLGSVVWGVRYRPDSIWTVGTAGIINLDSSKSLRSINASPFTGVRGVNTNVTCAGIWVATANNGIYYTEDGDSFTFIDTSTTNRKLVDNRVNAIALSSNCNDKFVGTAGGFSICPGNAIPCQNFTTQNSNLKQNDITSLAIDCQGRVWLATRDSGIMIFAAGVFLPITMANGLPDNRITSLNFNPANCQMSVGTKNGSIAIVDSAKNVLQILSGIGKVKEVEYTMHVFPQPANTSVTIISERHIRDGVLRISDMRGATVAEKHIGDTERFEVDATMLENGIYLYTLYSEQHEVARGKLHIIH